MKLKKHGEHGIAHQADYLVQANRIEHLEWALYYKYNLSQWTQHFIYHAKKTEN